MGNHPSVSTRIATDALSSQDREIQQRGFLQLQNTHDVSLADEHIPQVENFVADLQEAVNAIRSSPNEGRYKEVHCLTLSWTADNLGVKKEIQELQSVLSRLYRFEIHEYEIHGEKPGRDTQSQVATFLREHDDKDNLLILYYAGHAMPSRQGSEAPIWAATDKTDTPTVSSGGIQAVFEEADSDVLLLYDCCHSAHPAVTVSGHGVTEVIAASGFEAQAPGAGNNSFTHSLIQALTQACRGPPFSVAKLHEMVLRSLKSRTRDHLKDARTGEIWTDIDGHPVLQRHPTSTPIHCFLTEERPHRGIVLAPLPVKTLELSGSLHSKGSSGTSEVPLNSESSRPESQNSSKTDVSSSSGTNVLLSIRLQKDYFKEDMSENVRSWREWIRNIPPEAKDIKIEAIYESFSTLVLLTLPITLWNLLPNNSAYSFVGFVTSHNHMSELQTKELEVQVKASEGKLRKEPRQANIPLEESSNQISIVLDKLVAEVNALRTMYPPRGHDDDVNAFGNNEKLLRKIEETGKELARLEDMARWRIEQYGFSGINEGKWQILRGSHGIMSFGVNGGTITVKSKELDTHFGQLNKPEELGRKLKQIPTWGKLEGHKSSQNPVQGSPPIFNQVLPGSLSTTSGMTMASSLDSDLNTDGQQVKRTLRQIRQSLPESLKVSQPEFGVSPVRIPNWSATDLVERAKIAWDLLWRLHETKRSVKIAKLTYLYNVENLLRSLMDLSDLEYQASEKLTRWEFNLGESYEKLLIRVANSIEWYLVLAQVVLLQTTMRGVTIDKWAGLTQSLLFDEENSLQSEKEEAERLQVDLEVYVELATLKIRTSKRTRHIRGTT